MKNKDILESKIKELLSGIDSDNDDFNGWWETSTGAQFGVEKLDALLELVCTNFDHVTAERDALQVLLTAAYDLNDTTKSERDAALAKLNKALELLRGTHTGDLFGPDDWETIDAFLSATTMTEANDEK